MTPTPNRTDRRARCIVGGSFDYSYVHLLQSSIRDDDQTHHLDAYLGFRTRLTVRQPRV